MKRILLQMKRTLFILILSLYAISSDSKIFINDGPNIINEQIGTTSNWVYEGSYWNHKIITYYFSNGTYDISGDGEKEAIRSAMDIWEEHAGIAFIEVCDPNYADIKIKWTTGNHGDGYDNAFDGASPYGPKLAHAFSPPPIGSGEVHFDDDETWTTITRDDDDQPIDLVTVAAHELGHALGLDHTGVSNALMNEYYYANGGSHRYLAQDDIEGITEIYGTDNLISGPNYMCYPNSGSFSVDNPAGTTVTFSKSANIDYASGYDSNSNPCVFEPKYSTHTEGWIEATITSSNCDEITLHKDVGLTPPGYYDVEFSVYLGTTLVEPYGYSDWILEPNTNYNLRLDYSNPYGCSITDIDFNLPGSFYIYSNPFYYISFRTPSTEDWYSFSVDITSECGTFSDFFYGYLVVGDMYLMTFSPNPSSSETIVTLLNKDGDINEDLEWDMEVYDMGQNLKAKKEKIKGNKHTLNVSGWKTGVYIVRAKVGDKVVTGRLAVE